jgi:K+-transporting ATPase KdpF subunit
MTAAVLAAAIDNWVGLGLAALLVVFLVIALLRPERF